MQNQIPESINNESEEQRTVLLEDQQLQGLGQILNESKAETNIMLEEQHHHNHTHLQTLVKAQYKTIKKQQTMQVPIKSHWGHSGLHLFTVESYVFPKKQ